MRAWFLPAGDNLELMRAAFEQNPRRALQCWQHWRSRNTLDACEGRLHRLFPLLFRKFEKLEMDGADLNILRGVYRYNWTRNQLLARSASLILAALQAASVEVIVLKGMALAHVYYQDVGTRPMQDLDLLIRSEQRDLALQVLVHLGWQPWGPIPKVSAQHACAFSNEQGQQLDLHWYANGACCWPGVDEGLWQRAQQLVIHNVATRTLCPSDHLVQVLIHGAKDGVEPIGWAADAFMIMGCGAQLDWGLFLEEARRRRMIPALLLTLGHLQAQLGLAVPSQVMQELKSTPVAWLDRCYCACKIRGGRSWSFWLQPLLEYLRGERRGFLRFLCDRWGLRRIRQIPGHLLGRLRARP